MNHPQFKAIFLMIAIGVIFIAARADLNPETGTLAIEGHWETIYDHDAARGFEALDGLEKCSFVVAAHLSNHNQIGYELRKRLTDAEWAEVDHWMPHPDGMYMKAGEAIMYAMISEIRGNYEAAKSYCERGMSVLEELSKREDLSQSEAYTVQQNYFTLMGVYGAICYEQIKWDRSDNSLGGLAAAYRQLGEQQRLITEIEQSAKQLGVDSLLGSSRTSAGSDSSSTPVSADELLIGFNQQDFMRIDTILGESAQRLNAYFCFAHGNVLSDLGRTEYALDKYWSANSYDPQCRLYWKAYLEHETRLDWLEVRVKDFGKQAKNDKADSFAVQCQYDCYLALGQPDKVVTGSTKYLKQHAGDSFILAERARAYFDLKDYVKAAEDASAAVAADANNYEGWYVLGQSAQANNDPKAKEYFEKAAQLSPQELKLHSLAEAAIK